MEVQQSSTCCDDEDEASEVIDDPNRGRFASEFLEPELLRRGRFSDVFRVRHRTDDHVYAVERRREQMAHGEDEAQFCEARALASVAMSGKPGGCQHVLRYFSAWLEAGKLHLQTEICELSLRDRLLERAQSLADPRVLPDYLAVVLRHAATGLAALHDCGFAHLDVRPENILIGYDGCHKIAGLALAVVVTTAERPNGTSAAGTTCRLGDRRYLPEEILEGGDANPEDLPKVDVFALGLTCYEMATNPKALPYDGPEWCRLRGGHLDLALPLHGTVIDLLRRMVREVPGERPCCVDVARHDHIASEDERHSLHEALYEVQRMAERDRLRVIEFRRELEAMRQSTKVFTMKVPEARASSSPPLGAGRPRDAEASARPSSSPASPRCTRISSWSPSSIVC